MATVLPPLKDTPMSPPPMSLRQDSHQGNCPDLCITEYMVEDLWQMIKKSSDYGATPDTIGGMSRLALTEDDASFRAWFRDEALSMGCEVRVDRVGNMFAVLPGRNRSLPPIGIGSHLDTQPCGGRFDGILGVLAGLEVIKAMNASDHKPWADIAIINWTNEEGANYTAGCTGSAVWSHHITLESALAMPRIDHQSTFGDDLRAIGYDGPYIPSYQANPLSAHFELHIEQGVELEREAKQIGIVSRIQGIRWYIVEVHGVRAHAGSTCMDSRADAVVAASKMVCYIDELSRLHELFGTVGNMEIPQASSNVVSGFVRFTIDLRHREECRLTEAEAAMYARMDALRSENPHINFRMRQIWHSPAAKFDRHALKMVRESAMHIVGKKAVKDEMLSYAGHDSALVHLAGVPTAMIFVPSRGGISHAPGEFTSRAQCGIGLKVMYATVNAFDRWLESRDGNL